MRETGTSQPKVKVTAAKLMLVVAAMFGFGFALVPLYDVFCDITGLNGKTSGDKYVVDDDVDKQQQVDTARRVTVQFLANNNNALPWAFRPDKRSIRVNPGELVSTTFFIHNPEQRAIVIQAVPSITPSEAVNYFHKTECFCFEQQRLAEGESMNMPLRFIVDTELPEEITQLTLSYTLFDITDAMADVAVKNI